MRRRAPLGLLVFLAGCPGPNGPAVHYPPFAVRGSDDALVMPASGMVFPVSVGPFQRVMPRSYGADGTDVSVGYLYLSSSGGVSATVYVYPAPALSSFGSSADVVEGAKAQIARSEFDRRKAELTREHPDARLLDEHEASLTQDQKPRAGWRATYVYGIQSQGVRVPVKSILYTFCHVDPAGRWAMEYRIDYPASVNLEPMIAQFMEALHWTFLPAR